jgi:uncharacterized membrane protein
MLWPILVIHISAATAGLLSGALAMMLRKGSSRHGAAGTVFFGSMLIMTSTAAYIAAFLRPNALNVVVALLTFYLVTTAWWTARHRDGRTGAFEVVALVFILLVAAAGLTFGFEAASSPTGAKDHMPAGLYFFFGSMALLGAISDIRMLARGGVTGPRRVARHLYRMCFALLIATFSFYPGQAKLFPMWLRETNLLFVPHVLLLGSMLFHRFRVMRRNKAQAVDTTRELSVIGRGPGVVEPV